MKRVVIVTGLALLVATPGCGRYGWIGAVAQAPFRACICDHPHCTREQHLMAEEYAALSPDQRVTWLGEHNCPGYVSRPRAVEEQSEYTDEVDEFTGHRSVVSRDAIRDERDERIGTLTILGSPGLEYVTLSVTKDPSYGSRGWRWLECHDMHALADDVRIAPTDVAHDGNVMNHGCMEHVRGTITIAELRAIGQASRSRIRICNDIIFLSARLRANARRIAEVMFAEAPQWYQPADQPIEDSPPATP